MGSSSHDPAYLRIASDLRRRIREGALRPNQRVPSTRHLAKTWKVALATASKALGLLAHEGIIFAVPRVGNVVAGAPVPEVGRVTRDGSLDRRSIVVAAVEIADREGLGALSMRGVAAKMGVPVTSLYRHVPKKDDLVSLMVDHVMAAEARPTARGTWRTRLEVGARLEWKLVRTHPWVARVMTLTRPLPSETSLAHADWMFGALEESGVDATTMMQMHVAIYAFVQGLASNLDTEAQAVGETGVDEGAWMHSREPEFLAIAASGGFPAFARVMQGMPNGFELDLDRVFEFALALLIDGFARGAAKPTGQSVVRTVPSKRR